MAEKNDIEVNCSSEPCFKKIKLDISLSPEAAHCSKGIIDQKSEKEMETKEMTWRGAPKSTFTNLLPTNLNVPPVALAPNHEVYVKLPLDPNKIPKPYPDTYTDIWSSRYVRMPNSPDSLYPLKNDGDPSTRNKVVQRWKVIKEAFEDKISSVAELRRAILSYNHRYEERWKFAGLQYLLEQEFCAEESEFFFESILPKVIKLALDLPQIVTRPLILLTKKCTRSISLSQRQVACLLANAFLCTFPRRNAKGAQTEYSNYPDINFNRLFLHKEQRSLEKLKCIIHYFKEVTSRADLNGMMTFSRQFIRHSDLPEFQSSSLPLSRLHIDSEGLIEAAQGMLQVDFANKFIGGGVLGLGCVQEEIRFVLCPELLISRLFTEVLDRHEALIITGVEQFSQYKGYASNFEWTGPYRDTTGKDIYGRKLCQVLALDALRFASNPAQQYKPNLVMRELEKAYAGFKPLDGSKGSNIAVATGNWGCGAFKGNAKLKGLIQIAAASMACRDVLYLTFGDEPLRDQLADMHEFLTEEGVTVGQLVMVLCQYGLQERVNGSCLFNYLYRNLSHYDSDTDSGDKGKHLANTLPSSECPPEVNVPLKSHKTIKDYFKPAPKSEGRSSKAEGKSEGKCSSPPLEMMKSLFTEDKIMKALNECDRLVKGKEGKKSYSASLKAPPPTSSTSSSTSTSSSKSTSTSTSSSTSTTSTSSSTSTSTSSLSQVQSSVSLFDCLNKIDQTLT